MQHLHHMKRQLARRTELLGLVLQRRQKVDRNIVTLEATNIRRLNEWLRWLEALEWIDGSQESLVAFLSSPQMKPTIITAFQRRSHPFYGDPLLAKPSCQLMHLPAWMDFFDDLASVLRSDSKGEIALVDPCDASYKYAADACFSMRRLLIEGCLPLAEWKRVAFSSSSSSSSSSILALIETICGDRKPGDVTRLFDPSGDLARMSPQRNIDLVRLFSEENGGRDAVFYTAIQEALSQMHGKDPYRQMRSNVLSVADVLDLCSEEDYLVAHRSKTLVFDVIGGGGTRDYRAWKQSNVGIPKSEHARLYASHCFRDIWASIIDRIIMDPSCDNQVSQRLIQAGVDHTMTPRRVSRQPRHQSQASVKGLAIYSHESQDDPITGSANWTVRDTTTDRVIASNVSVPKGETPSVVRIQDRDSRASTGSSSSSSGVTPPVSESVEVPAVVKGVGRGGGGGGGGWTRDYHFLEMAKILADEDEYPVIPARPTVPPREVTRLVSDLPIVDVASSTWNQRHPVTVVHAGSDTIGSDRMHGDHHHTDSVKSSRDFTVHMASDYDHSRDDYVNLVYDSESGEENQAGVPLLLPSPPSRPAAPMFRGIRASDRNTRRPQLWDRKPVNLRPTSVDDIIGAPTHKKRMASAQRARQLQQTQTSGAPALDLGGGISEMAMYDLSGDDNDKSM